MGIELNINNTPYSSKVSAPSALRTAVSLSQSTATATSSNAPNRGNGAASSIDLTNTTRGQLRGSINELIKEGKVSVKDASTLVSLSFDGVTPNAQLDNEPINALNLLQSGVDYYTGLGQPDNAAYFSRVLAELSSQSGSVVNQYA